MAVKVAPLGCTVKFVALPVEGLPPGASGEAEAPGRRSDPDLETAEHEAAAVGEKDELVQLRHEQLLEGRSVARDRLLDLPAHFRKVLAEEEEQSPRRALESLGGRRAEASDADVGSMVEVLELHAASSSPAGRDRACAPLRLEQMMRPNHAENRALFNHRTG